MQVELSVRELKLINKSINIYLNEMECDDSEIDQYYELDDLLFKLRQLEQKGEVK